jgi:hypothetical protein
VKWQNWESLSSTLYMTIVAQWTSLSEIYQKLSDFSDITISQDIRKVTSDFELSEKHLQQNN